MKAIIIARNLSSEERQKIASEENAKVYITDQEFSGSEPWKAEVLKVPEDVKREINRRAMVDLLSLAEISSNGKPIITQLNLCNFKTWYYHRMRIYFEVVKTNYDLWYCEILVDKHSVIDFYTNNKNLKSAEIKPGNVNPVLNNSANRFRLSSLTNYLITIGIRLFISFFQSSPQKKELMLLDGRNHYSNILDMDGSTNVWENSFLGYLYKVISSPYLLIDVLLLPGFNEKFVLSKKHFKNYNNQPRLNEEWVLFLAALKMKPIISLIKGGKKLKKKYRVLASNVTGNKNHLLMVHMLENFHPSTLYFYARFLSYRKFFRRHTGKLLAGIDEYSPNFKLIFDAAMDQNLKTCAIQHGNMHEFHPGYRFGPGDVSVNNFPNHFLLWGEKWKEFLAENNLGNRKIKITGSIRTDVIPEINPDPERLADEINSKGLNKKIALFATQPVKDLSFKRYYTEICLSAFMSDVQAFLIIKLHPRENDFSFYNRIAADLGVRDYVLVKEVDIYFLLRNCDVVVTQYSTVGMEAVYFEKPLITIDPMEADLGNYQRDGVAKTVRNKEEMDYFVQLLVKEKLNIDRGAYQKYITRNVYKIDGNSSLRCARELKSISKVELDD